MSVNKTESNGPAELFSLSFIVFQGIRIIDEIPIAQIDHTQIKPFKLCNNRVRQFQMRTLLYYQRILNQFLWQFIQICVWFNIQKLHRKVINSERLFDVYRDNYCFRWFERKLLAKMFVKLKDSSTVKTAKMVSVGNIIYLLQSSVFCVISNDFGDCRFICIIQMGLKSDCD